MKNLILASMIALATAASLVPADAAKIVIKAGHDKVFVNKHHRDHCRIKTVKHWRHGHVVVNKVRVCK